MTSKTTFESLAGPGDNKGVVNGTEIRVDYKTGNYFTGKK
jgi:hypothetical protein